MLRMSFNGLYIGFVETCLAILEMVRLSLYQSNSTQRTYRRLIETLYFSPTIIS